MRRFVGLPASVQMAAIISTMEALWYAVGWECAGHCGDYAVIWMVCVRVCVPPTAACDAFVVVVIDDGGGGGVDYCDGGGGGVCSFFLCPVIRDDISKDGLYPVLGRLLDDASVAAAARDRSSGGHGGGGGGFGGVGVGSDESDPMNVFTSITRLFSVMVSGEHSIEGVVESGGMWLAVTLGASSFHFG